MFLKGKKESGKQRETTKGGRKMKRQMGLIGICLIAGIVASGCGNGGGSVRATGLGAAIAGLEAEFDVGERTMKAFGMIGAEDGFGLIVNGEEIELYKFDPKSDNAKRAKETGTMQVNGWSFPAVYNEKLDVALIRHDEHPQGDKIKRVFEDIK